EAVLLVESRLARLGAEADLRKAVVAGAREQCFEQLGAGAVASLARDHGDRQLGRLLVHEAEPGGRGREKPIPRGAVGVRAGGGDHARVAAPAPVLDVAVDRQVGIAHPPVVRVAEHVAEEARVHLVDRAEHQRSSCASWIRLPSGSYTSRRRISPVSSRTIPTSTPASRRRSASSLRSVTSTCATPSSVGSPSASPISISPRRNSDQRASKSTASSSKPSTSW